MQNIITDMKKRIPELEKKIKAGYTTIDIRTGKAFKSFKERHIEHLKEKVEWAEANRKQLEAKHKLKLELKNKKRLKPEEKEIVVAEEIRESLQGEDEINQVYEKQIEDLQKKKALYQQQLDELTQKEEEAEVKETEPHKVECPECHNYFTKGGAFTAHLRSHFPNSNSKE